MTNLNRVGRGNWRAGGINMRSRTESQQLRRLSNENGNIRRGNRQIANSDCRGEWVQEDSEMPKEIHAQNHRVGKVRDYMERPSEGARPQLKIEDNLFRNFVTGNGIPNGQPNRNGRNMLMTPDYLLNKQKEIRINGTNGSPCVE